MLSILAAHGWRQKARVGLMRILEHPGRPRVYIYLVGRTSRHLAAGEVRAILGRAGIEGRLT